VPIGQPPRGLSIAPSVPRSGQSKARISALSSFALKYLGTYPIRVWRPKLSTSTTPLAQCSAAIVFRSFHSRAGSSRRGSHGYPSQHAARGGGAGATGGAGASDAAISLSGDGGGKTSVGPPEHLSPGYGAGYDAGFHAGLLAASQGRAPPPVPPPPPVAVEGGAGASAPERPPFFALLEDFPDLFQKEVDLALLGRTGSLVRTAVKRSGLPRVGGSAEGPRVGIAPFCQSLSTFVWAVANGSPWQLATTSSTLAEGGHLEGLQWAREHGCPWSEGTCPSAARGGHLEVLRWAREHDRPWDETTCALAARGGHLAVLRWAREHGCQWNWWTCAFAAEGAHLEVLQWAREHHYPWDEETSSLAAEGGHLEVLRWAREHGAPWNSRTCRLAALGGHLAVLQWARGQNCDWDEETCAYAAANGHLEVLRWLREHNCPWNAWNVRAPPGAGTWRCCVGRGSTSAPGIRGCATQLLGAGTWRC